MCNIGVIFCITCACGAKNITLVIEHQESGIFLDEGQYYDGVLYVWEPDNDSDEPLVFEFEGDNEIFLELNTPGIYLFTAQTLIYNEYGEAVGSSGESNSVEYEVIERTETIPEDNDSNEGEPDEEGGDEDPNPDDDSDEETDSNRDRSGSADIIAAGIGSSPCGCFIGLLNTQ